MVRIKDPAIQSHEKYLMQAVGDLETAETEEELSHAKIWINFYTEQIAKLQSAKRTRRFVIRRPQRDSIFSQKSA